MIPFAELLDFNDESSYIALLKLNGISETVAQEIFHSLKAVNDAYSETFAKVEPLPSLPYRIIESDIGPQISHSRVMVYDVLAYLNQGLTRGEIAYISNLTLAQVDVALSYIEHHRPQLMTELAEIKARQAQEEAYYRQQQAKIQEQIANLPPTPARQQFEHLKQRNRQQYGYHPIFASYHH